MSARSRSPSELADVLLPALQAKPRRDTNHGRDGPEREPGVEMVQRDGSPGERLDEGALDGGQLIMTAEVDLNRSDEPIEPGGAGPWCFIASVAERLQLISHA